MLTIKSEDIRSCVKELANNVRAENISYKSYLDLYSGIENVENIYNVNNNVIYGRRGSGKTHLLRALSEKIIDNFHDKRAFPVYIDLRRIIPLIPSDGFSAEVNAILIFKYVMQEVSHSLSENLKFIFGLNQLESSDYSDSKLLELKSIFSKIYLEFDGKSFRKSSDLNVTEEERNILKSNANLSKNPSLEAGAVRDRIVKKDFKTDSYVSILDITNEIDSLIDKIGLNRIYILLDEWSEVQADTQLYLAEIIKRIFSALRVSLKIAAIPNRTNLGIKTEGKFVGLEDGGDIFGYPLDMRYVFEVNKSQTRDFFNDLIFRHLSSINDKSISSLITESKSSKSSIINLFFANVAMNEVLVACAGIPRDFMNLFLNSFDKYLITSGASAKRISVKNVRAANSEWYETDKKEQIDKHPVEKQLLTEIVKEVIERKKSIHFLIPEKYARNKHIQNLIDFRVLHLRKSGYSHKDHSGVSYNVYSIDYGCYNSINITKNKLDSSVIDNLNLKELREIRRVSLEDSFFQKFLMDIGEAFSCPKCSKPIDTNHLAYIKQGLCNNCYEKVVES